MLSQDYLGNVRQWRDGGTVGQVRQHSEIVWASRDLEKRKENFDEYVKIALGVVAAA